MGADVEIGKRRAACSSPAPIFEKTFAGQETGLPGKGIAAEGARGKHLVELLDALETDRIFRIDDRMITSMPPSAQPESMVPDQSPQSGSSVTTSKITLLSTRTWLNCPRGSKP